LLAEKDSATTLPLPEELASTIAEWDAQNAKREAEKAKRAAGRQQPAGWVLPARKRQHAAMKIREDEHGE
jgi:hypothetical protein